VDVTVTAEAGCRWHDVLGALRFPSYCTPIFGNNPGQQIRIGGTASVGGVGMYGSRVGGFWNHIKSAKVVTMRGDIVECSPTKERDLFRYAIAGFGRVGIIGELSVAVLPSKPTVVGIVLVYFDLDKHHADFMRSLTDPRFVGVIAQEDLSGPESDLARIFGKPFRMIMAMCEVDVDDDVDKLMAGIKADYQEDVSMHLEAGKLQKEGGKLVASVELAMRPHRFSKIYLVYFVPKEESFLHNLWNAIRRMFGLPPRRWRDPKLQYPWGDCVLDRTNYRAFVAEARAILERHGVVRYLEKASVLHDLVDVDSFVTCAMKRIHSGDDGFPLALDLPQEDGHSLVVAIKPDVPKDKLDATLAAVRDLTDATYSLKGRRYLYGVHDLSRAQVEQHFGRETLDTWQRLKDQHDPKHLLNIGVIEHLDETRKDREVTVPRQAAES
jgi:FAD/FMN-containing dehydrogenase